MRGADDGAMINDLVRDPRDALVAAVDVATQRRSASEVRMQSLGDFLRPAETDELPRAQRQQEVFALNNRQHLCQFIMSYSLYTYSHHHDVYIGIYIIMIIKNAEYHVHHCHVHHHDHHAHDHQHHHCAYQYIHHHHYYYHVHHNDVP